MNDLIINGIDHSVFDLYWAKRGGIAFARFNRNDDVSLYYYNRLYNNFENCNTLYDDFFDLQRIDNFVEFRMATPEECADAGVEYIEPPARWRPVDNAPLHTDVLRLYYDGSMSAGWIYCDGEDSVGKDVRAWQPRPQLPKDE